MLVKLFRRLSACRCLYMREQLLIGSITRDMYLPSTTAKQPSLEFSHRKAAALENLLLPAEALVPEHVAHRPKQLLPPGLPQHVGDASPVRHIIGGGGEIVPCPRQQNA